MDYYRRIAFEPEPTIEEVSDNVYLDKMQKILSTGLSIGVPPEPSNITGVVYVGTLADAENLPMMKAMRIDYLLNCADSSGTKVSYRRTRDKYGPDSGIQGYIELGIDDSEHYNVRAHFERAHSFIDYARSRGGRVLIYCPGVSRSGAIALSYMVRCHTPLLEATKILKTKRRVALCNTSFMAQLVAYARDHGMLDLDVRSVRAPTYGRALEQPRIKRAHLPLFI